MEPSNELLNRLRSIAVVKDRISFIKQQASLDDKNDAILTVLREAPDNLQKTVMDDFIASLRSCGQQHVANIFKPESDKVPMSDEHRKILVTKTDELCKFLDPENGVLNKLFSLEVITSSDVDRVSSKDGFHNMTRELINTILRKPDDAFQTLTSTLDETGQSHVVYILTGNGNSQPLSENYRRKLREQRELTRSIIPRELMPALISKGVFTLYDQERVKGQKTNDDKAEMMFDLIARKSQVVFNQFIETLRQCYHKHVAERLMGPEVASTVELNVRGQDVDMQNLEGVIREDFLQTLAHEETEVKQVFLQNGISVMSVSEGSIIVKFTYEHHAALIWLKEQYDSRKLDQLFTEAFRPKFASKGLESLRVVIPEEEFKRHFKLKLMTDDHRNAVKSLAEHCFDKVTISDEFLNKLSLRKPHREVVVEQATHEQQVKTLLDTVSRQPDSAFTQLCNALDDTQQTDAASYLNLWRSPESMKTVRLHSVKEESR